MFSARSSGASSLAQVGVSASCYLNFDSPIDATALYAVAIGASYCSDAAAAECENYHTFFPLLYFILFNQNLKVKF